MSLMWQLWGSAIGLLWAAVAGWWLWGWMALKGDALESFAWKQGLVLGCLLAVALVLLTLLIYWPVAVGNRDDPGQMLLWAATAAWAGFGLGGYVVFFGRLLGRGRFGERRYRVSYLPPRREPERPVYVRFTWRSIWTGRKRD